MAICVRMDWSSIVSCRCTVVNVFPIRSRDWRDLCQCVPMSCRSVTVRFLRLALIGAWRGQIGDELVMDWQIGIELGLDRRIGDGLANLIWIGIGLVQDY